MWSYMIRLMDVLRFFEAKYTKNQEKLESTCNTALQQIDERLYAKEYEDDYDRILCYGISFSKNGVLSRKVNG